MAPTPHFSTAPNKPNTPNTPTWDISFTRLANAVRPQLDACGLELARRFKTIGWACDTSVRQTPRGVSTLLALVGQRGLICIVDMTLIDGMAVGQGPCAALDMRLLDASGDVVAEGLASGELSHAFHPHLSAPRPVASRQAPRGGAETTWERPGVLFLESAQAFNAAHLARALTAVYVTSLAHFDLLRSAARSARHA
ncbi:MAG: hypothetical protein IV107_12685 [Paucibacter sp.]|nr:hypothetical protein [Roseateles sp.]